MKNSLCRRLIYLVGPSGAGKDTLLAYARERLEKHAVTFAHRYITRPADIGNENHIALSAAEFATRQNAGLFALFWHSHGYSYAIGIEIDIWLKQGCTVVVSGSRAALDQARQRYPDLQLVWVTAANDVLLQRLLQRGRESATEVKARLQRAELYPPAAIPSLTLIKNNGLISESGDELINLILNQPS